MEATVIAEKKKKASAKKKTSAAQPGQRGKYAKWLTPGGLELLGAWARDGLTDKQLADKMGVAESTYYEWRRRFPALAEAVADGKEVVDVKVENALLKRALGYTYTETKREGTVNGIKNGTAKITMTEKTVPPDVTAQIFWLSNRKPDKWRKKVEAVSVIETKGLALEELEKMVLEEDESDENGSAGSCGADIDKDTR